MPGRKLQRILFQRRGAVAAFWQGRKMRKMKRGMHVDNETRKTKAARIAAVECHFVVVVIIPRWVAYKMPGWGYNDIL